MDNPEAEAQRLRHVEAVPCGDLVPRRLLQPLARRSEAACRAEFAIQIGVADIGFPEVADFADGADLETFDAAFAG